MHLSIRFLSTTFLLFSFFAANAQWTQSTGPSGIGFFSMLRDGNRIWGTAPGGLFYSDNEGESWQRHPQFKHDDNIYALCRYNGKLFVTSELVTLDPNQPGGLLLSSADGGETWQAISPLNAYPSAKLIPANGMMIFRYDPLVKYSTDEGQTWNPLELPCGGNNFPNIPASTATMNFVVGCPGEGLFNTTDAAQTWTKITDATFDKAEALSGNKIIAQSTSTGQDRFISTDLGVTWTPIIEQFPGSISYTTYHFYSSDTLVATNLGATPQRKFSTDNGQTWADWTQWGTGTFLPDVLTSDGGLQGMYKYYSATGIEELRNEGLLNSKIEQMAFNDDYLFTVSSLGMLSRSSDRGQTWEVLNRNWPDRIGTVLAVSGDTVFVSSYSGILYVTHNGESLPKVLTTIPLSYYDLMACGPYLLATRDYGSEYTRGFLINRNDGTIASEFFTPKPGEIQWINGRLIQYTKSSSLPTAYISDDNGQSWTKTLEAAGFNGGGHLFNQDGVLWIFAENTVFNSTDRGETWNNLGHAGLPFHPYAITRLAEMRAFTELGGDLFVAAYDFGVYRSEDGGQHWAPYNEGLAPKRLNRLLNYKDRLIAGAWTSSIWLNDPESSKVLEPARAQVLRASPNPGNGVFYLETSAGQPVAVFAYNALGELVWQSAAVVPKTPVNLSHLPDGVYWLKAVGKDYQVSVQIVIRH